MTCLLILTVVGLEVAGELAAGCLASSALFADPKRAGLSLIASPTVSRAERHLRAPFQPLKLIGGL